MVIPKATTAASTRYLTIRWCILSVPWEYEHHVDSWVLRLHVTFEEPKITNVEWVNETKTNGTRNLLSCLMLSPIIDNLTALEILDIN